MKEKMIERAERLNEILRKRGAFFQVVYQKVYKNTEQDSYILKSDDNNTYNACPCVYFSEEWWKKADDEICTFFQQIYYESACRIDIMKYLNAEYVSAHVLPRLTPEASMPYLAKENKVCVPFVDLAVVFYVPIDILHGTQGTMLLTYSVLEQIGLSINDVVNSAVQNMEKVYTINSMDEVISVLDNSKCISVDNEFNMNMIIISNTEKLFGASAILCQKMLTELHEKFGEQFILLPSSIHEFIAIPCSDNIEYSFLKEIVEQINCTEVDPEDKLSDNVYVCCNGTITPVF